MSIQVPPIPQQRPNRVFGLFSPVHLFSKLCWEIEELKILIKSHNDDESRNKATYFAFNAAVTAWHLTDWVWASAEGWHEKLATVAGIDITGIDKDKTLVTFQKALRHKCPALEICWDIANGSKHRSARKSSKIETSIFSDTEETEETEEKEARGLCYQFELTVWDGTKRRSAIEIFEEVSQFWDKQLRDYGFLGEKLVLGEPSDIF